MSDSLNGMRGIEIKKLFYTEKSLHLLGIQVHFHYILGPHRAFHVLFASIGESVFDVTLIASYVPGVHRQVNSLVTLKVDLHPTWYLP